MNCVLTLQAHVWEPRAIEHLRLTWGGETYDHATRILRRCSRCGRVRTRQIEGTWTAEQLGINDG